MDPKSSRPAPLLQRRKSEPLQYYITDWSTAQNPVAARQAQWKPLPLLPPYPYTSYSSPYSHNGYEHFYEYPYLYNDTEFYDYTSQRADAPKVTGKAESREQPQTHGESQHPPRK